MKKTITEIKDGPDGTVVAKTRLVRSQRKVSRAKVVAAKKAIRKAVKRVPANDLNQFAFKPVTLPPDFYNAGAPPMTTIRLFGKLGRKHGRQFRLRVSSPREAVHAIDCIRPGFRADIARMKSYGFAVHIGDRNISDEQLDQKTGGKTISIRPVALGSANKGVLQIIAGVALIAVGILLTGTPLGIISPYIIGSGVSLVLGGIASLIAGTPSIDNDLNNKQKASYQFGGAVNIAAQGAPAALPYGRVFCGSVVGSASIFNRDITKGSNSSSPGGGFRPGGSGNGLYDRGAWRSGDFNSFYFPEPSREERREAMGAGGGGDSARAAVEDPDTLQSKAYANIKDIIGEGPVRGLVDGERSVYLADTPLDGNGGTVLSVTQIHNVGDHCEVVAATALFTGGMVNTRITGPGIPGNALIKVISGGGTIAELDLQCDYDSAAAQVRVGAAQNFHEYELHFKGGTQDQTFVEGFESEEATTPPGGGGGGSLPLPHATPWVQDFSTPNLDAIRFDLRLAALRKVDKKTGDIHGSEVRITVELNTNGGGFVLVTDDLIKGKASSAYVRTYKIDIPQDSKIEGAVWTIRVTRVTVDAPDAATSDATFIDSQTTVTYVKLRHPNTCYCALRFNAEQWSSIPTRTYHIDGLLIKVPTNYDPDAHTYAGDWDGNFKTAWTCNPAWVLWDILTHNRYGLGNYVPAEALDKWAFYAAAQHCDELVPSGYKLGGVDIMERRYECHAYIAGRKDAINVISDIAGIFAATAAYLSGLIVPIQDKFVPPEQYAGQYNPTNVIDGDFNFTTPSRRAQHTAVLVEWNDPADLGRPKTEYVDDQAEINRIGYREAHVTAFGCYSRGQAHRVGRRIILTEKARGELCSFKTGLEGATHIPGDVIQLSTTFRAGKQLYGRTAGGSDVSVALDRPMTLLAGKAYQISVYLTNGEMVEATVANEDGIYTTLNLTTALPAPVAEESVWILVEGDLVPETYRVLSVSLLDKLRAELSTISYVPSLYDAIELGLELTEQIPTALPSAGSCLPAGIVTAEDTAVVLPTGVRQDIHVTWVRSADPFISNYQVHYRFEKGNWIYVYSGAVTDATIRDAKPGAYEIRVIARNSLGAQSTPSYVNHALGVENPLEDAEITGLEIKDQGLDFAFRGLDVPIQWRVNSPANNNQFEDGEDPNGINGLLDPFFQAYVLTIYADADATQIVQQPILLAHPQYIFSLSDNKKAHNDAFGLVGPFHTFTVGVRLLDAFNHLSPEEFITVHKTAPAAPVEPFNLIPIIGGAQVMWGNAEDPSRVKNDIWMDAIPFGVNPGNLVASTSGDSTQKVINGTGGTSQRWFWVEAVDAFGLRSGPVFVGYVQPLPISNFNIGEVNFLPDGGALPGPTIPDNLVYLSHPDPEAQIWYAINTDVPPSIPVESENNHLYDIDGEIGINDDGATIIARAFKNGLWGPPKLRAFTRNSGGGGGGGTDAATAPIFDPAPGYYESDEGSLDITFASPGVDAIFYTKTNNGSTPPAPTHDGSGNPTGTTIKVAADTAPLTLARGLTYIKAIAAKAGFDDSVESAGNYQLVRTVGPGDL